MKKIFSILLMSVFIAATVLLTSCSKKEGYKYIDGKVNIVATTTMLGDLASVIGGDLVSVTTLMNVGVDPHNYQPRPSDSVALTKSDLVLVNGLHLEAQMGSVIGKLGEKVLTIGEHIDSAKLLADEDGAVDPHIWFDVTLWKEAAAAVLEKLQAYDPENAAVYVKNAQDYDLELDSLHSYVLEKVSELPEEKRILVTAHDAFRYYSNAYGFKVYSIQGISTETEASAKDIQDLANLVVELKVKAIFIESSVPQETVRSVINAAKRQKHDVTVGGELFSDSLGSAKDNAETYLKTIRKNTDTIINALK